MSRTLNLLSSSLRTWGVVIVLFIRTLVMEPYAGVNTDVCRAQNPFNPLPAEFRPPPRAIRIGVGELGAHLMVVEVPVDGEAVAADAPLLAGGAGAAPAAYAHVAPRPHQLWRLLWLRFGGWKRPGGRMGLRPGGKKGPPGVLLPAAKWLLGVAPWMEKSSKQP